MGRGSITTEMMAVMGALGMAFQGSTIYIHQLESQFSHMYEMS